MEGKEIKHIYYELRSLLFSTYMLNVLIVVNLIGTVYGYYWYKDQLELTWSTLQSGLILFVPDSPTSSLLFTLSLIMYKYHLCDNHVWKRMFRSIIGALGFIYSFKYGIWAVSMILASAWQGVELGILDWMLISSHLAMAIEVVIYVKVMSFGKKALFVAALVLFFNDYVDYAFGIFPWLAGVLMDDLVEIRVFTFSLSALSIVLAFILLRISRKQRS